jgi:hypothetical protein
MKTRIIQTRFWDDNFIYESDVYTQHLYIYLLTSQYINISGIFQLPEGKIKSEAKLTDKQFEDAKQKLIENKKVFFKEGWVYVKNAEKNNNYRKSPSNETAYQKEMSLVPSGIIDFFKLLDSSVDSTVYSTYKSEIRNKKSEIRNKEKKWDTADKLRKDTSKVEEIADFFKVDVPYVMGKIDFVEDYAKSEGKIYYDYNATVRNFIRRDIGWGNAPVKVKKPSDLTLSNIEDEYFKLQGGGVDLNYAKSEHYKNFVKERLKELGYDS